MWPHALSQEALKDARSANDNMDDDAMHSSRQASMTGHGKLVTRPPCMHTVVHNRRRAVKPTRKQHWPVHRQVERRRHALEESQGALREAQDALAQVSS